MFRREQWTGVATFGSHFVPHLVSHFVQPVEKRGRATLVVCLPLINPIRPKETAGAERHGYVLHPF